MASWQFASWIARFASYWALLDAFHIGGSVRNALLVLAVQVVASVFPFTPGGAGVQQALLLTIFAHNPYVASFSVGQQIATAVLTSVLGFAALVLIFRFKSFREVIARGRAHRRGDGTDRTGEGTDRSDEPVMAAERRGYGGEGLTPPSTARYSRQVAGLPSACVIGAGSSGIAAVKALHERGIPVDCFEKSDRVGGNWVFANKNGMSSAYRSLHTNTSRERMEYSDFPMPKSYPDFPHHTQIAQYFSDYVAHFGLARHDHVRDRGRARGRGIGWRLDGHARYGRHAAVRRAAGRQRSPLGSALARAAVPGAVRRRADAFAPLRRRE